MTDTEKITINLGAVDLGRIDLLVREGLYSNRSDFIRSAIRSQTEKHGIELQQAVTRSSFMVGLLLYDRAALERVKEKGERLDVRVIGSLVLAHDIPAELASEVIERVEVRGLFNASPGVKAALADRMR